jgi:hypothetical protein
MLFPLRLYCMNGAIFVNYHCATDRIYLVVVLDVNERRVEREIRSHDFLQATLLVSVQWTEDNRSTDICVNRSF